MLELGSSMLCESAGILNSGPADTFHASTRHVNSWRMCRDPIRKLLEERSSLSFEHLGILGANCW